MIKVRFYLLIFILLYSCKKETEQDYRDKLIGTYNFTCIFEKTTFIDPDSFVTQYDTTKYIGTVNKYGDKQLSIIFLDNATEPKLDALYFPIQINGIIYPEINDSSELSYPELTTYSQNQFSGSFFNDDSLYIFYGVTVHRGNEKNKIYGVKKQ
jgi:hypothetical protein